MKLIVIYDENKKSLTKVTLTAEIMCFKPLIPALVKAVSRALRCYHVVEENPIDGYFKSVLGVEE